MEIRVLGGHGGLAPGFSTTSFLIDGHLLIDAGSVASTLSIEEQAGLSQILISHSHLDHIKDLAFLCDNCFGMRPGPFLVYSHPTVNGIIKQHLFNDTIWPDFSLLPTAANPTIRFLDLMPEVRTAMGDYFVTGVKVQHQNDAMGFIVEKDDCAVLFTLDTGPTERIWEVGKRFKKLRAIFTEVSFPNALAEVARISDHHTPASMEQELKKMPGHVPVILTHVKPNFRAAIEQELQQLAQPRLRLLKSDGESFQF
jgi:ribonuclease BN (tRNA processing enzyme)